MPSRRKNKKCIRDSSRHRAVSLNGHDKNVRNDIERKKKKKKKQIINKYISLGFGKKQNKGHSLEGKVLSSP